MEWRAWGKGLGKHDEKINQGINTLDSIEERALFSFNKCCMKIKQKEKKEFLQEFPLGHDGLMRIRLSALNIFLVIKPSKKSHMALFEALLQTKPHWKNYFEPINGNIKHLITKFFLKLCNPTLSENNLESYEMKVDPEWYSNPLTAYWPKEKSQLEYCIVHPERKIFNKKRGLCGSCSQKISRLNLNDYDMDLGLLYVLKIRLGKKGSPGTINRCPNHSRKIALRNGLCEICNGRLGKLEEIFRKEGLNIKSLITHISTKEK